MIAAQQASQLCEAMLTSPTTPEDDSSIDIIMRATPLMLAGSAISRRERYAGGPLAPGHGWYVKPRSTIHWWNHFVFHARVDDERWREMFCLTYHMFTSLVQLVRNDINQKPIPEPLSHIPGRIWTAEKKVGLAIMLLSLANNQHHVANCFGCGHSIVSKILHQFVAALIKNAGGKVHWRETAGELVEIKAGFQAFRGLPNCCGAIDAIHINMHLPKIETNESRYDRYGNYSMLVQGIVDANIRFLDVNIGWPGLCNDKRVLQNSGFYRLCQGRERLAGPSFNHENLSI
ncbi:hypothetical protein L7F22_053722 [Adiantum nelumboides]|nr:hypothetical protein [Adiantum nelumboides]